MNKKNEFFLLLLVLIFSHLITSYSYINALGHLPNLLNLSKQDELFTTFDDTINKQLKILLGNKEQIKKPEEFRKDLEKINEEINNIKKQSKGIESPEKKYFFQEKLSILNQQYQAISEIEQTNYQTIQTIDNHTRLLCQYRQDPDFSEKNLRLESKRIYSFDEIQVLYNKILDLEKQLKELEDKRKKASDDLSNREKALILAKQKYQEKKKQQATSSSNNSNEEEEPLEETDISLNTEDQAELIDEQEELLKYKRNLAEQRLQEIKQRVSLLESEISTQKVQLQIIYNEYDKVKGLVKVSDSEKQKSQEKLENIRQEIAKKQKEIKEKIGAILIAQDSLEEQIEQYKDKFNIKDSELSSIDNWSYSPKDIESWKILIKIGKSLIKLSLNNVSKQLLESRSELAKAQLREQEAKNSILITWYRLTQTEKNYTQEEFNKDIKQYETLKAEIQSDLSFVSDRKLAIASLLNTNAKLIENIKETKNNLIDQKSLFKDNSQEYDILTNQIKKVESDLKSRGEIISKLNELYINTNATLSTTLKKVQGIIDELKNHAQWLGVASSVWKGLRNFWPDIKAFFKDIQKSIIGNKSIFVPQTLEHSIKYFTNVPYRLFSLIIKVIISIALSLLIRFYLPDLKVLTDSPGYNYKFGNRLINFFSIIINFLKNNVLSLLIWFCLLIIFKQLSVINPYLGIIFYLLSIPYLIYYIYKFINYIFKVNIQNDYIFISEEFNKKFFAILSFLVYSTVIILLFRQAFLLGNYPKSDVPTTLLAINFLFLQISLTFFISRDQVLSLIPTRTNFGQIIHELVDRYYYLFLAVALVIIFISNPYIGFGPQFFSIIVRIILITLLIPLFTVIHTYVKKYSVPLFFKSKGGVTKERFGSSKTFYGIFIIFSFLFFVVLALVIGANIWGYTLGFEEIRNIIHNPLFPSGSFDRTGQPVFVTTLSLFQAGGLIVLGLLTAYLVNKFILRKIFDLLLVNVGVQSALMSLTRYFILLVFFIIALQTARLSSLLIYILAVLGGIGFAAKDLITDMLSYFIILIQRPIKIGDLVRIDGRDDKIIGVVRQITLRSIILRSKNSYTVIIPNSYVMNNPVANWNYSPTFIGTHDILITISYKIDPQLVKELIFKVLDQNINILKNPIPIIWLSDFTENGFLFTVRGFLSPDKVLDIWTITSELRLEIVKALKDNNIEIATPSRIIVVNDSDKDRLSGR